MEGHGVFVGLGKDGEAILVGVMSPKRTLVAQLSAMETAALVAALMDVLGRLDAPLLDATRPVGVTLQ